MGEVTALRQIHGEHEIPQFHRGEINSHVCLSPRVGLDVSVLGSEELLQPVTSEILGDVMEFATAVIPLSRVALCIFVGHYRAHGLEHCPAD